MQGRSKSSPSVNLKDGKYDGLKDFEMTNLKVSQTRDTEISNTYTDRNKFTIDENSNVTMSNLNGVMTGMGYTDPAKFVQDHPNIIAAYGAGKNFIENAKVAAQTAGAVKQVIPSPKPQPPLPISGGSTKDSLGI